jgi:hypothetical protein
MADPWKALVTGSRTWRNRDLLYSALNGVLEAHPTLVLIHGAAREGADAMADAWRTEVWQAGADVTVLRRPARWRVNGKVDKGAGFKRNALMVAMKPDEVLAFIDECRNPKCRRREGHGTHGASDCADLAERAGIPVRLLTP